MNRDLAEWVSHVDEVDGVREIAEQLSPDARKVLLAIARRMQKGQEQYGLLHLDVDPRDWRNEIAEELMDALVYMACEEVQIDARK